MCLGLAGAFVRRSPGRRGGSARRADRGGRGGGGASIGLFPIFFRHLDPISGDLLMPMIAHVAVWSAIGRRPAWLWDRPCRSGKPGAICSSGARRTDRCGVGAIASQFLGAFCFPQAQTDMPLAAEPAARLLAWP